MFSAVIDLVKSSILAVFDWWAQLNTALGTTLFVVTFVVLCLLVRYIVLPHMYSGFGAVSDSVNRRNKEY